MESQTMNFSANPQQPISYNFGPGGQSLANQAVSQRSLSTFSGSGLFKLLLLVLIPLGMIAAVGVFIVVRGSEGSYQVQKKVVLSVPMKNVNWQDLGNVFEPVINLPIKTASGTYEEWEFLLDSGAVVSSLPRDWAEKMGKDLAFMKRSTFRGFGGKTSFAYQGEMTVLLGEQDKNITVVFTEASGTKSLLGRKGFFEDYSVYFNHIEKKIEIRQ